MHSPAAFRAAFARAKPYSQYLETAKPHERPNWDRSHGAIQLDAAVISTLQSLPRRINTLVISGTWCGDCVQQCPIFDRFARAHPAPAENPDAPGLDVRFIDRDVEAEFVAPFKVAGGQRVPTVLWLSEEFDLVGLLGDGTLSRYRAKAQRQLGAACPVPSALVPPDELRANIQDWANEFERIGLLLRLSAKLRSKHGD